jgi:hypothetical protein
MEAESILGIYAQLSVVMVGLSGIAGVIGHRATGNWQLADYYRFWTLLASGFLLLFQSTLPIILLHFSLADRAVWGWSSGIVALLLCGQLYWRFTNVTRVGADARFIWITWWFGTALQVSAAIILILNTAGLGFDRAFGPYLLAMWLVLAVSCLAFIRLLIVALPRN